MEYKLSYYCKISYFKNNITGLELYDNIKKIIYYGNDKNCKCISSKWYKFQFIKDQIKTIKPNEYILIEVNKEKFKKLKKICYSEIDHKKLINFFIENEIEEHGI